MHERLSISYSHIIYIFKFHWWACMYANREAVVIWVKKYVIILLLIRVSVQEKLCCNGVVPAIRFIIAQLKECTCTCACRCLLPVNHNVRTCTCNTYTCINKIQGWSEKLAIVCACFEKSMAVMYIGTIIEKCHTHVHMCVLTLYVYVALMGVLLLYVCSNVLRLAVRFL